MRPGSGSALMARRSGLGAGLLAAVTALSACGAPTAPAGAPAGLHDQVAEVTRSCLDHGFAAAAVADDLRGKGFRRAAPLVPMLAPPAGGSSLQLQIASPCTIWINTSEHREARSAIRDTLRAAGLNKLPGEQEIWADGTRQVRMDRRSVQPGKGMERRVGFSLSPAG